MIRETPREEENGAAAAAPPSLADAERREARREAIVFSLVALAVLAGLAVTSIVAGWNVIDLRGWIWFVLTAPLVLMLAWAAVSERIKDPLRWERGLHALMIPIVLANFVGLGLLIATPLTAADAPSAAEEFLSAVVLYVVNIVVFGLWFWTLDCGGPVSRILNGREHPDFLFPQDENVERAPAGWHPQLGDYMFIACTNAIAFSPSDAMPLSGRAKVLMALESMTVALFLLILAVVLTTN